MRACACCKYSIEHVLTLNLLQAAATKDTSQTKQHQLLLLPAQVKLLYCFHYGSRVLISWISAHIATYSTFAAGRHLLSARFCYGDNCHYHRYCESSAAAAAASASGGDASAAAAAASSGKLSALMTAKMQVGMSTCCEWSLSELYQLLQAAVMRDTSQMKQHQLLLLLAQVKLLCRT